MVTSEICFSFKNNTFDLGSNFIVIDYASSVCYCGLMCKEAVISRLNTKRSLKRLKQPKFAITAAGVVPCGVPKIL